jgi:ribose transport system permease protein
VRDTARQLALLACAVLAVAAALAVLTWLGAGRAACPFLDPGNLLGIVRQSATTIVLAVGMTFVILAGGIDLSVGSVMAFGSVLIALGLAYGLPTPLAVLLGVAGGGLCGLVNGIVSVKGGVPSFIATLGMYLVARSAAFLMCGGQTLYEASKELLIPALPVALPILAVAGGWLILSGTRTGRGIYAVGGNLEAARLSGLPTARLRIGTFVAAGLGAGLASVIYWARTGTGSNLAGGAAELDAIAAVVIGGTSISGGEGHVLGSLLGALLMTILRNGLVLAGLSDEHQKLAMGVVIVAAVLLDRLRAHRSGGI